ncbi:hypothetical protein TBLA_0C02660 [Henningerozyma blattae CBS 6284]|uniref:Uncharacterized protein n=1 Tax=Henningerozyma blattae (strain ATCC 34711 / CBS 6284 / DSM 70876 / NBRC 10599 / NRRL Y-10934 / UCD 77-7) TaxID=1071380 RepID=I2H123_HENB6|nr:hypothetical protein TBLA_0C02660 [Tetrapisispora blattae CBS 6284]CCH60075.1 hypothetical protein TBLA_0C02660 [Tetrapisispora blattae CBS 6284]
MSGTRFYENENHNASDKNQTNANTHRMALNDITKTTVQQNRKTFYEFCKEDQNLLFVKPTLSFKQTNSNPDIEWNPNNLNSESERKKHPYFQYLNRLATNKQLNRKPSLVKSISNKDLESSIDNEQLNKENNICILRSHKARDRNSETLTNRKRSNRSLAIISTNSSDNLNINLKYLQKSKPSINISGILKETIKDEAEKVDDKVNKDDDIGWTDLDKDDFDDPLMVSEDVKDIFKYLFEIESTTLPIKERILCNVNIRNNRDMLINWMVKIHYKFMLLSETLYLAINIMDRFLSEQIIPIDKLQLVGTSALFIASKYEEVYSPSIKSFVIETDGACTISEIKDSEKFILKILGFKLNYPNPMNFLRRISKADDYHVQTRAIAKFLLEITIIDFNLFDKAPSICAAASMFLARKLYKRGPWDNNLIHYSGGYTKEQLKPIVQLIINYINGPIIHPELIKKYGSKRFDGASLITINWIREATKVGCDIIELYEMS